MTSTSIFSTWLNRLVTHDYDPQARRYLKVLETAGTAPMGAAYVNGRAYVLPVSQPSRRTGTESRKPILTLGRILNIKMAVKEITEYEQRNTQLR